MTKRGLCASSQVTKNGRGWMGLLETVNRKIGLPLCIEKKTFVEYKKRKKLISLHWFVIFFNKKARVKCMFSLSFCTGQNIF